MNKKVRIIIGLCILQFSGFSGTISKIKEKASGATVSDNGLSIISNNISSSEKTVRSWIDALGIENDKKGKVAENENSNIK